VTRSEEPPRIDGQIVIVTGASQGIGLATARELAARGGRVVLVCRDPGRGAEARADVARAATGPAPELALADLSSQQSVRALAADLRGRFDHIDVLVSNAGAIYTERRLTVDGIEETLATNHLAPFLLVNLVRDRLEAAPAGRVVVVSSGVHARGTIDFDDLQGERSYGGMRAYSQAKLGNILFTFELARRLAGTRVTANCLHPGVIASGFGRNNRGVIGFGVRLIAPFLKSPETGARTSIYLASSPEVAGVTGTYFVDCAPARSSRRSQDPETAARLWDVSAKLTGLAPA